MTQIATIEKLLDSTHAEVAVARQSACAHECSECAGCGGTPAPVHARAVNPIGARPGQKVVVQSNTKSMMGIILLVYMVPVVLFFAGYFLALPLPSEAMRFLVAGIAFAAGLAPAILYDRRLRRQGGLDLTIVRLF